MVAPLETNGGGLAKDMTLRDWYIGQALANPLICTGTASEWQLEKWFGGRGGLTREEIAAKQARVFAGALLIERERGE